jgi:hypothetical protein
MFVGIRALVLACRGVFDLAIIAVVIFFILEGMGKLMKLSFPGNLTKNPTKKKVVWFGDLGIQIIQPLEAHPKLIRIEGRFRVFLNHESFYPTCVEILRTDDPKEGFLTESQSLVCQILNEHATNFFAQHLTEQDRVKCDIRPDNEISVRSDLVSSILLQDHGIDLSKITRRRPRTLTTA